DAAATSAPAQGFCVVFQGGEAVTAPGLLWSEALLTDIGTPGARLGGIGPLGIDPAVRGAGAGLAMVAGAASWLRGRGATDAVINWTTLTSFYGRLGARICRTYQRSTPVSLLRQGTTEAPSVSRAAVKNGVGPDNESAARETSA